MCAHPQHAAPTSLRLLQRLNEELEDAMTHFPDILRRDSALCRKAEAREVPSACARSCQGRVQRGHRRVHEVQPGVHGVCVGFPRMWSAWCGHARGGAPTSARSPATATTLASPADADALEHDNGGSSGRERPPRSIRFVDQPICFKPLSLPLVWCKEITRAPQVAKPGA